MTEGRGSNLSTARKILLGAILAIHQGSGGLLRRANLLAKGALMAAAHER
jgi:hypothetical protein